METRSAILNLPNRIEFDEEKHIYRVGGVALPSVTGILKSEGFIYTGWYDDYSRQRGEYVHKATALYDQGELDEESLDPAIIPYLEAWKRFKEESKFHILEIENPVASIEYSYCGTPDRIGSLNQRLCVIDIKTGNIEPWTALQLVAYALAYDVTLERHAIQLKNDRTYKLTTYKDRQDRYLWLSVIACYQWKKNNLRRK